MALVELVAEGVRNLQPARIVLGQKLNWMAGSNGSGKTSILEAIHILGLGRSFRTHRLGMVCQSGKKRFMVGGTVQTLIGQEREDRVGVVWEGTRRTRLNGDWLESHGPVVERFPLIAMHADLFEQVVQFPMERRRLLDWGAFYWSSGFAGSWRRWRRAHEQRNAWLREEKQGKRPPLGVVERFEEEAAKSGSMVTDIRTLFVHRLNDGFQRGRLAEFMMGQGISVKLEFRRGWSSELDLQSAYEKGRSSDSERGYGQVGPQRADLEIMVNERPLREASRGEQKRVIFGLCIGQGLTISDADGGGGFCGSRVGGIQPVMVLDDPLAELDRSGAEAVVDLIREMGWQVVLTSTDMAWVRSRALDDEKVFHVEHGSVECVSG